MHYPVFEFIYMQALLNFIQKTTTTIPLTHCWQRMKILKRKKIKSLADTHFASTFNEEEELMG